MQELLWDIFIGRRCQSIAGLIPLIAQYIAPPLRWNVPDVIGGRFGVHGMVDIAGLTREYLRETAVTFTFNGLGYVIVLWRDAHGDHAYVNGSRRVPVECSRPEYLVCEMDIGDNGPRVYFMYNDELVWDGHHAVRGHDHVLIYQPHARCREFYVWSTPLPDGRRRMEYHGRKFVLPPGYVTSRVFGRGFIYGLRPDGTIDLLRDRSLMTF